MAADVMRRVLMPLALLVWLPAAGAFAQQRGDLLIADFEGPDYGDWKVEGEAFGPGPARGTRPGQMAVSGFEGKGLLNSFFKGDDATGTLTSPAFEIRRNRINFLIGGGMYPREACINLSVDGKVVRTATGLNDRPGGTERLDWHSWDVTDLLGKTATIQIVDNRRGGWGHINVDQIVQSDRYLGVIETTRDLRIEHDYVSFRFGAAGESRSQIQLIVDGEKVRYDVAEKNLSCLGKSATVEPVDGRIELRVLVDRTSIEIFANRGRVVMSFCFLPNPADRSLGLVAEGQAARVVSLALRELRSAWPQ